MQYYSCLRRNKLLVWKLRDMDAISDIFMFGHMNLFLNFFEFKEKDSKFFDIQILKL
jgi:hypothetical protein